MNVQNQTEISGGIDVGKSQLDVAIYPHVRPLPAHSSERIEIKT